MDDKAFEEVFEAFDPKVILTVGLMETQVSNEALVRVF